MELCDGLRVSETSSLGGGKESVEVSRPGRKGEASCACVDKADESRGEDRKVVSSCDASPSSSSPSPDVPSPLAVSDRYSSCP